jgi:hypothetical protein
VFIGSEFEWDEGDDLEQTAQNPFNISSSQEKPTDQQLETRRWGRKSTERCFPSARNGLSPSGCPSQREPPWQACPPVGILPVLWRRRRPISAISYLLSNLKADLTNGWALLTYNYYNWRQDVWSDLQLFMLIFVNMLIAGSFLKHWFVDDIGTSTGAHPGTFWEDLYQVRGRLPTVKPDLQQTDPSSFIGAIQLGGRRSAIRLCLRSRALRAPPATPWKLATITELRIVLMTAKIGTKCPVLHVK